MTPELTLLSIKSVRLESGKTGLIVSDLKFEEIVAERGYSKFPFFPFPIII